MVPGGSRFWRFVLFLCGLVTYSSYRVKTKSPASNHIVAFVYIPARILALGPRFGLVLIAQVKGFGSRGSRSGQIFFEIFEILDGAGDIQFLPREGIYLNKIISLPLHVPPQGL